MEKINITELLKDCPKGMELDCTMYENVYFGGLSEDKSDVYPITVNIIDDKDNEHNMSLTKEGCWSPHLHAKCVIFPKGKTNWEGFQRPFKDGDIVCSLMDSIAILGNRIGEHSESFRSYCGLFNYEFDTDVVVLPQRFATEEEKKKLFDVIKANGYRWNSETKTLEKLPKFKVGDKVRYKNDKTVITITGIKDDYYFIQFYNVGKCDYQNEKVSFKDQDKYELVPNKFDINTLVPFESRVLVRGDKNSYWKPAIFGCYMENMTIPYCVLGGNCWRYCIPYEGNEHLRGKIHDCDEYFKTWK